MLPELLHNQNHLSQHIDSPLLFGYMKGSFYRFQYIFHLTDQCIFKQISVLSFDADFAYFTKNALNISFLLLLLAVINVSHIDAASV